MFLTTHDMVTANELCDRVAFLVDGHDCRARSPRSLRLAHGRKVVRRRVPCPTERAIAREFAVGGLADDPDFLSASSVRRCRNDSYARDHARGGLRARHREDAGMTRDPQRAPLGCDRSRRGTVSIGRARFWSSSSVRSSSVPESARANAALWVPAILVINLQITTFFFVAGLMLLERDEGTLNALAVSPLSPVGTWRCGPSALTANSLRPRRSPIVWIGFEPRCRGC